MSTAKDVFTIEFWSSHMEWIEVTDTTAIVVLITLGVTLLVFIPIVIIIWCHILSLVGCTRRIRRLQRMTVRFTPIRKWPGTKDVPLDDIMDDDDFVLVDHESDNPI